MSKIFFTFLLLSSSLQGAEWFSQYWQRLNWEYWKQEPFSLTFFSDVRSGNHFKSVRYYQLTNQFAYEFDKWSFELHYTYIRDRPVQNRTPTGIATIWSWQQRLEIEANHIFALKNCIQIITRNRFEIRKLEHNPKIQYRLRQRTKLFFPINWGKLKAYQLHNELFYDLSTHLFNQDRFCPMELLFELSEKVDLSLFFLLRFYISENIWRRGAILGTEINF